MQAQISRQIPSCPSLAPRLDAGLHASRKGARESLLFPDLDDAPLAHRAPSCSSLAPASPRCKPFLPRRRHPAFPILALARPQTFLLRVPTVRASFLNLQLALELRRPSPRAPRQKHAPNAFLKQPPHVPSRQGRQVSNLTVPRRRRSHAPAPLSQSILGIVVYPGFKPALRCA